MSDAIDGFGSKVYIEIASVMTVISEATNLTPPGLQKDTYEVTHLNSPGKTKEFKSSLRDPGEMSFDLNYIPDDPTHQAILDAYVADDTVSMKVEFSDGSVWGPFDAIITGFETGAEKDGPATATVTAQVTGEVNWLPA